MKVEANVFDNIFTNLAPTKWMSVVYLVTDVAEDGASALNILAADPLVWHHWIY